MTSKKEHSSCIMTQKFFDLEKKSSETEGKVKGNNELTLQKMGHIEKTLERIEKTLNDSIIENRKREDTFVKKEDYNKDLESQDKRVGKIEWWLTKINWAILIAVISGILSFIIKK